MKNALVFSCIKNIKPGQWATLDKTKELDYVKVDPVTGEQHKGVYTKCSHMVVRLGVDYKNMAEVKKAVAQAAVTPSASAPTGELPWGHWLAGWEGYVIEHDPTLKKRQQAYEKAVASGVNPSELEIPQPEYQLYLRVANSFTDFNAHTTYVDETGREVDYTEVQANVAQSKLKSQEAPVYAIKFDDIVSLTQNHSKSRRSKKRGK